MSIFANFLGFLLLLPAASEPRNSSDTSERHRRAIGALGLSPHLLHDIGLDDYQNPADDPRWSPKPDLDR